MVLQVAADARQVDLGRDACGAKIRGIANARQLQQLRRVHGTAAKDHLTPGGELLVLAGAPHLHAPGDATFDQDPAGERAGPDGQVRPRQGRLQEGIGRTPAVQATLCDLIGTESQLRGPVEIGVARILEQPPGLEKGLCQPVQRGNILHRQRSIDTVILVCSARLALDLTERRQGPVPAPALASEGVAPFVVIAGRPPDVVHRIDRTRTAQGPAPGPVKPPVVQPGLGFGLIVPVVGRGLNGETHQHRRADQGTVIRPARLQQQHGMVRIARKSLGQHTAGRAGTDDDEVVDRLAHRQAVSCRIRDSAVRAGLSMPRISTVISLRSSQPDPRGVAPRNLCRARISEPERTGAISRTFSNP